MNILPGIIEEFQTHGNLTLVKVRIEDLLFTTIVIETPESVGYLKQDCPIKVMFKETEVIISKDNQDISLQNRIPSVVEEIKQGQLLSHLILKYRSYLIGSIITSNAVNQLQIKPGSEVVAMIKTNEIMLSE